MSRNVFHLRLCVTGVFVSLQNTYKDSAMKISLDMVASMRLLVSIHITALNFSASRTYQRRQKNELTVCVWDCSDSLIYLKVYESTLHYLWQATCRGPWGNCVQEIRMIHLYLFTDMHGAHSQRLWSTVLIKAHAVIYCMSMVCSNEHYLQRKHIHSISPVDWLCV